MRKTAFFRIYTHSRFPLCTSLMCITHHQLQLVTLSIFSALFCPIFLLKNRFFLPQYQWNISQRRNLLIFSSKIRWNLTIFPAFSEEASSFCPKLSFSFWTSTKKIHKSHRSSISSYILWHRIVLFVPRFRINAHTFHFFRRTPAGYCPAPANAATFPCHTPPRSPL